MFDLNLESADWVSGNLFYLAILPAWMLLFPLARTFYGVCICIWNVALVAEGAIKQASESWWS